MHKQKSNILADLIEQNFKVYEGEDKGLWRGVEGGTEEGEGGW